MTLDHPERPTLLVLTRGPRRESRAKRLFPARLAGQEAAFHHRCLLGVLALGRDLGFRLVVSSPRRFDLPSDTAFLDQRGTSFAERFADALARACPERSGPLVVVGTDTPGLTGEHLKQALLALEHRPKDVILGPSVDGGFYLLATARPLATFNWNQVSWFSRRTRSSLRTVLARVGRGVSFLDPQADLDRPTDLERWLTGLPSRWRSLLTALKLELARQRRPLFAPGLTALELALADDSQKRAPPN